MEKKEQHFALIAIVAIVAIIAIVVLVKNVRDSNKDQVGGAFYSESGIKIITTPKLGANIVGANTCGMGGGGAGCGGTCDGGKICRENDAGTCGCFLK